MSSWTTPHPWTAGEDATSARLQTLTDCIEELQSPDRVWAYNSTSINIPDSTATALTFNVDQYDASNMHSTVSNTSRITIQTDGGFVFDAHAAWSANGTGYREIKIVKNGGTDEWMDRRPGTAGLSLHQPLHTPVITCITGDYFEVYVTQTSGGTLAVASAGIYGIAFAAYQVSG